MKPPPKFPPWFASLVALVLREIEAKPAVDPSPLRRWFKAADKERACGGSGTRAAKAYGGSTPP